MSTDLFGEPITSPIPVVGNGEKPRHVTKAKGYPSPPGSGPEGQTCKTCANYCVLPYHNKAYRKCLVIQHRWTHGPGTDIKASWPACSFWKPATTTAPKL